MGDVAENQPQWNNFHEELQYLTTEDGFERLGGQSLIDRYLMRDEYGEPSMVSTAWVMKAYVFKRPVQAMNHPSSLQLTGHGWEITMSDAAPPAMHESMIAHQLGHLMIMRHEIRHNKLLYPIGAVYGGANFAAEALCDFIGQRLTNAPNRE